MSGKGHQQGFYMKDILFFRKRSGRVVKFNQGKIASAIARALKETQAAIQADVPSNTPELLAQKVCEELNNPESKFYVQEDTIGSRIPKLEDVQDAVETVIGKVHEDITGYTEQVATTINRLYSGYRKAREEIRNKVKVISKRKKEKVDSTDKGMLLQEADNNVMTGWDRNRLEQDLNDLLKDEDKAADIAKRVEKAVLSSGLQEVTSDLIAEFANNELTKGGLQVRLNQGNGYLVEKDFIDALVASKTKENSNVVNNNPEAINMAVAEYVLKKWGFDSVFSSDVVEAHQYGFIYIHDLGSIMKVYCSSHSVEYLKKYGLQKMLNLNTVSKPAKSASVLTGHLNTFLASMQANYAGALGLGYINVFYAPLLRGMSDTELHQVAQELIFNGSQNAFSRGGQTLFLDFNIHTGVPGNFKDVPAILAGGKYTFRYNDGKECSLEELMTPDDRRQLWLKRENSEILVMEETTEGKLSYPENNLGKVLTYGDFEEETHRFCKALLTVWGEGDANGHIFEFPKCDFHVSEETFSDPKQNELYQYACEITAKNGSVYYVFDRDSVTVASCCRLKVQLDASLFKRPESLRSCGFANCTINIPQCSYRTGIETGTGSPDVNSDTWKVFISHIDRAMDLAVKAHLQKKAHISRLMSAPGLPLWQVGMPSADGNPYIDLNKCVYIIGLIGLDDACRYLFGKSMYEDEKLTDWGLAVIAHMNLRCKHYSEEYGLTFTLEESPAESAARKLARTDLVHFPEQASSIVHGYEGSEYYTNSIHIPADADVTLVERVIRQSMFHGMIDSGAITHAFIGEETPSPGAIADLVEKIFKLTQSAQITFSPEFTYCQDCHGQVRGLVNKCPYCGSSHVEGETRVVGYFSRVSGWNKSKIAELQARHHGRYKVEEA